MHLRTSDKLCTVTDIQWAPTPRGLRYCPSEGPFNSGPLCQMFQGGQYFHLQEVRFSTEQVNLDKHVFQNSNGSFALIMLKSDMGRARCIGAFLFLVRCCLIFLSSFYQYHPLPPTSLVCVATTAIDKPFHRIEPNISTFKKKKKACQPITARGRRALCKCVGKGDAAVHSSPQRERER